MTREEDSDSDAELDSGESSRREENDGDVADEPTEQPHVDTAEIDDERIDDAPEEARTEMSEADKESQAPEVSDTEPDSSDSQASPAPVSSPAPVAAPEAAATVAPPPGESAASANRGLSGAAGVVGWIALLLAGAGLWLNFDGQREATRLQLEEQRGEAELLQRVQALESVSGQDSTTFDQMRDNLQRQIELELENMQTAPAALPGGSGSRRGTSRRGCPGRRRRYRAHAGRAHRRHRLAARAGARLAAGPESAHRPARCRRPR